MAHKKTTNKPRLVSSRERSIAVLARSRTQHGKATLGLPTANARGDAAYPLTSQLGLAGTSEALFASFWMGGYEGADHVNSTGRPISLRDVTQHESQAAQDYARLADFGIRTVRESVGWSIVERDGRFDFSPLETRLRAAREADIQVVWTLCHYGWPSDVDALSPTFVGRFARYAGAAAKYLADASDFAPVYVPINEISFLAWSLCENIGSGPEPALKNCRDEVTRQLVRATLAACDAIWEADPRARIMHTDPLIHIAPPTDRPELTISAAQQTQRQFDVWDLLAGREAPELGGDARYLDLIGANYYYANQWDLLTGRPLAWRIDDPRRVRLARLLETLHKRYGRPLVVAETSHMGVGRGAWIREVAAEVQSARRRGAVVEGICIYPIIDRPDWDNPNQWHRSGLWDVEASAEGTLERRLNKQYATALLAAQRTVNNIVPARNVDRRTRSAPLVRDRINRRRVATELSQP